MHIKRKQKTCYKLIQDLLNCTCMLHSQATPSDNLTDSELPQPHNLWNLHQHILKQSSAPFWVQMDKFSCMNFREVSTCSNFISPLSYGARCGVCKGPQLKYMDHRIKYLALRLIKFPGSAQIEEQFGKMRTSKPILHTSTIYLDVPLHKSKTG